MLWMTSILLILGFFYWAWVSEQFDHSEIITSSEDLAIWRSFTSVDVRAIGTWWEDTLDWPSERTTPSVPWLVLVVGGTTLLLCSIGGIMEQDLITCAVGHQASWVLWKIDVSDRTVVSFYSLNWFKLLGNVVKDDVRVMSSNSTDSVIRGESDDLDLFACSCSVILTDFNLLESFWVHNLEYTVLVTNCKKLAIVWDSYSISSTLW